MDSSEIQVYEHQLAQVETALESDAGNEELKTLKEELVNLIALTRSLAEPSSSKKPAQPAKPKESKFAAGDEVLAKYAADARWYPARIIAVGGNPLNPTFSVVFKGYSNTETLHTKDLRPDPAAQEKKRIAAEPKLTPQEEAERERKRKRNEKKTERYEAKQALQVDKQQAWQKFAKKGGAKKPQKSIFKTPDDPYAKVGVVGAGRGMTAYNSRTKHIYDEEQEQSKR